MLGLTMRLSELASASAWADGLALAALLAFVIRPVLGGLVLLPVRLTVRERVFFLWTGLKGAVPILLGMAIVDSGTAGRRPGLPGHLRHRRLLGHRAGRPGPHPRPPAPHPAADASSRSPGRSASGSARNPRACTATTWRPGAAADGSAVGDLPCGENAWVSLVVRDGALLTVSGDTTLQAGDDVLVLADPDETPALERYFTDPAPPEHPKSHP